MQTAWVKLHARSGDDVRQSHPNKNSVQTNTSVHSWIKDHILKKIYFDIA